jgi:hypothetical protein
MPVKPKEAIMRRLVIVPLALLAVAVGAATRAVQDQCGPFTDVSPLFCPYVLEAYYTGITVGTSPTTFSPDVPITRGQAAVFTTKALNQALARGSRRAALGQWWQTSVGPSPGVQLGWTDLGSSAQLGQAVSDGTDVWVVDQNGSFVDRVHGSDGRFLENWAISDLPNRLLVAMGRVFVGGQSLSTIDPGKAPGAVPVVATIPNNSTTEALAFDGTNLWWGAFDGTHSLFLVAPGSWTVTPVSGSDGYVVRSLVFNGSNIWGATNNGLLKFDASGNILQTIPLGVAPTGTIVFDGANIWVPDHAGSTVAVVSAATGAVVATLSGNGIVTPSSVAFDGERVLVLGNDEASLFRAADLTPLGSTAVGGRFWVCSDGSNFWIVLDALGQLARY